MRLAAPGPGTPEKCTDCELRIDQNNLRICDWRTGTHMIFADLQLRTEPKSLRRGDLQNLNKFAI